MNIEPKAIAGDIPVYCAHDEIVDIMKVIPNPKNPNTHGERQIEILSQVIKAQGWRKPITVSKRSGFVVAGHGRLQAALLLRAEKVPVDYQEYATEAEEYADLVADNRIAELSEIDNEMLSSILEEIKEYDDFNFELTGYTDCDIDSILGDIDGIDFAEESEAVEDDYEVDIPDKPKANLGDIYQLGNHRLMCGDSTKIEDVKKLMDGAKADLVITDPPYNVDYEGSTKDKLKIKNDSMKDEDFRKFLYDAFRSANTVLKDGGVFYIWHSDSEGYNFRGACEDNGWKVRECLIWNKNSMVMGRQDYHWKHEPCLYGWKDGASHLWNSDRKQTTVLDFDRPSRNELHPTMKPIPLFDYQIRNSSHEGDSVLDLFGGSGTTIIACEQNKRKAYLMEMDPKYVDVIIDRWEQFTGEKAVLLTSERKDAA